MRREWRRFGPGLALGAAVLIVGAVAAVAATASPVDHRAAAPGSADAAAQLLGPCLLGIIGDCGPRPTPSFTVPSTGGTTPGPTRTGTTAPPSHRPTTSATRSGHPHSTAPTHHPVRTTVPAGGQSTHHRPSRTGSLPVAATTSIDPTPAGTTLSASDGVPATPDQGERDESSGMLRPLMQLLPIVAICLAIGLVVVITAARRGSRRTRAVAGHSRPRHRHAYSDAEELVHQGVWGDTR